MAEIYADLLLCTESIMLLQWSNLEILLAPLHCSSPFTGNTTSNSRGTRSVYIAETVHI
jgi:hypothetical protein